MAATPSPSQPPVDPSETGKTAAAIVSLSEACNYNIEHAFGVIFRTGNNVNTWCPFHNDTEGASPSCSVNRNGMFKCHRCDAKGTAVDFYAKRRNISKEEAWKELQDPNTTPRPNANARAGSTKVFETNKGVTLTKDLVLACQRNLLSQPSKLAYLRDKRGLSLQTTINYQIGRDEYRYTIPVYDSNGRLINIRRYQPAHEKAPGDTSPKMLTHALGIGTPTLYPWSVLDTLKAGDELFVLEGEWDTLLLLSLGLPAITNTGNCKVWSVEWTKVLRPFRLTFIYDANDKEDDLGQRMAQERVEECIREGVLGARRVELPLSEVGGDITNYFVDHKNTLDAFKALCAKVPYQAGKIDMTQTGQVISSKALHRDNAAPPVDVNSPSRSDEEYLPFERRAMEIDEDELRREAISVSVHEAASAAYLYKRIHTKAVVAGRGGAPFLAPKRIQVVVEDRGTKTVHTKEFTPWDPILLSLVNVPSALQHRIFSGLVSASKTAKVSVRIIETYNLEELFIIPAVDTTSTEESGPYTMRRCFYIGHGLETNRVYDLYGYTLPEPNTQAATHIFTLATPAETSLDNFELTAEDMKLLKRFQPDTKNGELLRDKLEDIASQLSAHVTHIYGRDDMHIAMDLCFHSAIAFDFEMTRIKKGWLDVLILGDTRTGKGYVAEGLIRHYKLGEIISGENLTLAGLIGGVQHVGDKWTLTWGKLPLSDRRLVVLDECTGMPVSTIARLSRIRSEGIAEITKVITEKTTARTRLLWIANPRGSNQGQARMITDFNFGIEAVPDLIGAPEDIARFDYCFIVAHNGVSSDVINTTHIVSSDLRYTSEMCQKLLAWVWSRRPEDIFFSEDAVQSILDAARALGLQFSGKIPLVQSEDVRFKLARIAVAAAARTFSTNDGQLLVVDRPHVQFAYNFLLSIYKQPCNGYHQMSLADKERNSLRDDAAVLELLKVGGNPSDLISGLLEHQLITLKDISDYTGLDLNEARAVLSGLVRQRALVKEHNGYRKKEAFKHFLLKIKVIGGSSDGESEEGDNNGET